MMIIKIIEWIKKTSLTLGKTEKKNDSFKLARIA